MPLDARNKKRSSPAKHAKRILDEARKVRNAICHPEVEFPDVVFQEFQQKLFDMQHLLLVEISKTRASDDWKPINKGISKDAFLTRAQ